MAKRESSPGNSPAKKRIRYKSGSNFNAEYTRTFDWVMASGRRTARFAVSISASLMAADDVRRHREGKKNLELHNRFFKKITDFLRVVPHFFSRNLTCLLNILYKWVKNEINYGAVNGIPSQIPTFLSLTLTLGPRSNKTAQFALQQVFCAPAKFGVAVSNGLGDVFTRNTCFDLDLRSHIMLPCTLYSMGHIHLQSLKWVSRTVWKKMHLQENTSVKVIQNVAQYQPIHLQSLKLLHLTIWKRCIYKKIHSLTLGSRSHKLLSRPRSGPTKCRA